MIPMSLVLMGCINPYDETELEPSIPTPVEIGPDGGVVTVGDLVLDIPAGALVDPVEILIYDTFEPVPEGFDGLTTIWSLEPHGLVFQSPVTITIPYSPPAARAALYWSNDDAGYDRISGVGTEGAMVAEIEHFSTAFVVDPGLESVETDVVYPPADVLFVVDNSCSMTEVQQRLADNFPDFVDPLLATGLDIHIGVVSTDMDDSNHSGKLRTAAGVNFIDADTPNPSSVFSSMANMGTDGAFEEKGRAAAFAMVELIPDDPRNIGFYRQEATLSMVFVSDEEDQSGATPVTPSEFRIWMDTKKAVASDVVAHGFFWVPGTSCPEAYDEGVSYFSYTQWTAGIAANLCAQNWTPDLLDMIEPLLDSGRVELPVSPDPSTVEVYISNQLVDPGAYRLDSSIVFFDQGLRPAAGDTVRVDYLPL